MNVMEKSDLVYTIKYLNAEAKNGDFQHRYALTNVVCVLEQALEGYIEDEQHPHLYLNIVKAQNHLDAIMDECCTTTNCLHYRQGTCSFATAEKDKCPLIQAGMRGYGIYMDGIDE